MAEKRRNIGIDLLRIVSMCMIIMIHMNGYGKASAAIDTHSIKYLFSQIITYMISCSVNVFAMISGYGNSMKAGQTNSVKKFWRLWLQVLFYSVALMLVFKAIHPDEISRRQMIETMFPALSMQYWYFSYYIPVLFLMPYLNFIMIKMDVVSIRKLVVLLFSIFSVIPWIFQTDWFHLNGGFSAFWLIILYVFGAWLRKEMEEGGIAAKNKKSWLLLIYAGMVLMQILMRYGLDKIGAMLGTQNVLMHAFLSSTSPFVVIEAGVLLLLFAKLEFSDAKWSSIISKAGAASFGVYLIHDNQFVRNYIMIDSLSEIGWLNSFLYVAAMLGTAVGIYVCCAAVELLREFVDHVIKRSYNVIQSKLGGV